MFIQGSPLNDSTRNLCSVKQSIGGWAFHADDASIDVPII